MKRGIVRIVLQLTDSKYSCMYKYCDRGRNTKAESVIFKASTIVKYIITGFIKTVWKIRMIRYGRDI